MNAAEKELAKVIEHDHVVLMPRGNAAIFTALFVARQAGKKRALIPDQGGWFTFKTYPKLLGIDLVMIPTHDGVIDPHTIPVADDACLLYAQPAGYFAEQDTRTIYEQCKGQTLVIMDASGSIGSLMCSGQHADMMVGSFSDWKPINIGYGGFISFRTKELADQSKDILSISKVHSSLEQELLGKLKTVSDRYEQLYQRAEAIKRDLAAYDIIHPTKKGINVIVAYNNEAEKKKVIAYCDQEKLEYTICPRFIRVNRKAVSIEVKRL
ncbi:hypothetical protein HY639_01725 [Candidatus Woesearchaeota archaeon]|nr:hypothetical protein [Candidatus Woesearchaeota archaeon]